MINLEAKLINMMRKNIQYLAEILKSGFDLENNFLLSNRGKWCISILLILIILLSIYPYYATGLTTVDDMNQQLLALSIQGSNIFDYFPTVLESAKAQGRVNFLWQGYFALLPYLNNSEFYFYSIRLFGFLSSILFAAIFAYTLTRSINIALALVVLIFGLLQDNWNHNLTTSYPFTFHATLAYFFIALIFLIKYLRSGGSWVLGFMFFYFLSLGVELFVIYVPFLFVLIYFYSPFHKIITKDGKDKFFYVYYKYGPLLIVVATYLMIYSYWRYLYPSTYGGNQVEISVKKIPEIFYTITIFSFSQLPGFDFFTSGYGFINLIKNSISVINFEWLVKAFLIFFSLVIIFSSNHIKNIKTKFALICAVIFFFAIPSPNILLGLTEIKRDWASKGVTSFVYSYYSLVALIFSIIFLFTGVLNYFNNKTIKTCLVVIFSVLISTLSVITDFQNNKTILDKKYSYAKWDSVSNFIRTEAFKNIPNNSIIVSPTLFESRGIAVITDNYWSDYIFVNTGKRVNVVKAAPANISPGQEIFFLKLYLNLISPSNYILLFSKINQSLKYDSERLFGSNIILYSPKMNMEMLMRYDYIKNIDSKFEISGDDLLKKINFSKESGSFYYSDIKFNKSIYFDSIIFSPYDLNNKWSYGDILERGVNFSDIPPSSLVDVSGLSSIEPWGRWSDANLDRVITLRFNKPLPKRFLLNLKAVAFGPNVTMSTKVKVGAEEKFINIKSDSDKVYSIVFNNQNENNIIQIFPPEPTAPSTLVPASLDSRKIGVGLIEIKIQKTD